MKKHKCGLVAVFVFVNNCGWFSTYPFTSFYFWLKVSCLWISVMLYSCYEKLCTDNNPVIYIY